MRRTIPDGTKTLADSINAPKVIVERVCLHQLIASARCHLPTIVNEAKNLNMFSRVLDNVDFSPFILGRVVAMVDLLSSTVPVLPIHFVCFLIFSLRDSDLLRMHTCMYELYYITLHYKFPDAARPSIRRPSPFG